VFRRGKRRRSCERVARRTGCFEASSALDLIRVRRRRSSSVLRDRSAELGVLGDEASDVGLVDDLEI
jgi:hypothetical protein